MPRSRQLVAEQSRTTADVYELVVCWQNADKTFTAPAPQFIDDRADAEQAANAIRLPANASWGVVTVSKRSWSGTGDERRWIGNPETICSFMIGSDSAPGGD